VLGGLRLATVAAVALAISLRRALLTEWFPRIVRAAGGVKRRVRAA
jgi:hypothetical protein